MNIKLQNGTCTNGTTGAFSNAALASQALSDLAQSTTQQTSEVARTSIETRRETEQQRCPEGFERVNGECRRIATAEPEAPPAPSTAPRPAPAPRTEAPPARRRVVEEPARPARVAVQPRPILKAPPPVIPPVQYASWIQGYGDYERRTGTAHSSINCCQGPMPPNGIPIPLTLTGESKAWTGGVLAGTDVTVRGINSADDAIIAGLLGGFTSSNVHLTTASIPPPGNGNLLPGSSTLSARLEGASAGAYATYFKGPFSADVTFRADFLNLHESFTDILAFTVNPPSVPPPPFTSTFTGAGSTQLINYTTLGNLNYRFLLAPGSWIEPTAGFQYTYSAYDSSAAALGLTNGHLLRLQAGARYGVDYFWDRVHVTTTLTGLLYDDVSVSGGFIQNVAFGANALIVNDEGKLRGEGILAFNFDYGNGVSLFALGDVRGGQGLFGAGGKGGVRWQW
jgi:hypothetical protein